MLWQNASVSGTGTKTGAIENIIISRVHQPYTGAATPHSGQSVLLARVLDPVLQPRGSACYFGRFTVPNPRLQRTFSELCWWRGSTGALYESNAVSVTLWIARETVLQAGLTGVILCAIVIPLLFYCIVCHYIVCHCHFILGIDILVIITWLCSVLGWDKSQMVSRIGTRRAWARALADSTGYREDRDAGADSESGLRFGGDSTGGATPVPPNRRRR